MRLLNECREKTDEARTEVMAKYEELCGKNALLLERLVRIQEERVKNETILITLEEQRIKNEEKRILNEEKLLNIMTKLTDDLM